MAKTRGKVKTGPNARRDVVARPNLLSLTPDRVNQAWIAYRLLNARYVAAELREVLWDELIQRALG